MTRSLPISCCAGAPSESSKGVPDDHGGGHGHCDGGGDQDCSGKWTKEEEKAEKEVGRKVMVVADGGSEEARTALQWALSHSVRPCDTVVLLDVAKPGKNGDGPKGYQQLEAMKSICQAKRPEVHVEVSLVEGKERGPAIVEAARRQGVSLLVMGQRRRSVTWRLLVMWMAGNRGSIGGGTVEYCVHNATCMALAVRQKSRRGGGYLITTRRHRDFWLLA